VNPRLHINVVLDMRQLRLGQDVTDLEQFRDLLGTQFAMGWHKGVLGGVADQVLELEEIHATLVLCPLLGGLDVEDVVRRL
jgi:hypothetical protein